MSAQALSVPPGGPSITVRRAEPEDAPVCGRVCFDAFYRISTNHGFPPDFPVARRICWHSLNDVFPPGVLLRGGRVRRMHGGQQLPR
jgi:hypothetical protein